MSAPSIEARPLLVFRRNSLRASLLAVCALLVMVSPLAAQAKVVPRKPLAAATAKLIGKQEKLIAKSEAAIAKSETKIALKEALITQAELDQDESQNTADFLATLLATAEQDLADALELPESTEEELTFKTEAIKVATLGVKLATKEQNLYLKLVAKYQKKMDKAELAIDKAELVIDKNEDKIAAAEAEIARLETPFDFDARVPRDIMVRVVDGQPQPIINVHVLIVPAMLPPKGAGAKRMELRSSGTVYAQGLTDASGEIEFELDLPEDVDAIDVLLLAPGRAGPYTHEALRERWGAFAPAARLTVSVDDLDFVQLALPLEN
ncbi:MAG: hypothetical protein DHS20C15_23520 [Planctomycetota bacterium]|nr:MAG: hypothetical protein DHS20C15_23520 [Planctomycetota bacterium]